MRSDLSGYDPYNNPGCEQREMSAHLEAAWKACITAGEPPEFIIADVDVFEALNDRRSYTSYPYGRDDFRHFHTWRLPRAI
jgi:hypothetical protein